MGMSVYGELAFGIKLPEEFKLEDDEDCSVGEMLDEIFYPFDKPELYPHLNIVCIGNCDQPEYIIATVNHSVEWGAIEINSDDLEPTHFGELGKFCEDFDLDFDPKWYLGCYYSY